MGPVGPPGIKGRRGPPGPPGGMGLAGAGGRTVSIVCGLYRPMCVPSNSVINVYS